MKTYANLVRSAATLFLVEGRGGWSLRCVTFCLWAAILLAASGCVRYGGYGSEEATYGRIGRACALFEQELSRSRMDLQTLEAALPSTPGLADLAQRYGRLVTLHETLVEEHHAAKAALSPRSGYRRLHRSYGALVTEQRLMRLRYRRAMRLVLSEEDLEGLSGDPAGRPVAAVGRPRSVIPPYYVRTHARVTEQPRDPTVDEVIARLRSEGSPLQ